MTRLREPGARGFEATTGFALRTPLQPFSAFERWGEGLEAPNTRDAALEGAVVRDRALLRARLVEWLDDPVVREALLVAAPDLHVSLPTWRADPAGERGRRVERALVRYRVRMCTRPTPFGLFAGHSAGSPGETTDLVLDGADRQRRHVRLDMDYLYLLAQALARDPELAARLLLRPNSSLHHTAGRIRYVESRLRGRVRSHHLVAIEPTEYLEATLRRAAEGATRFQLAEPLATGDVTMAEAEAFVNQLVEAQVLVTDLEPPVTGDEPLREQVRTLRAQAGEVAQVEALEAVQRELDAITLTPPGSEVERYGAIVERLRTLPAAVDLPYLFQVDLVGSTSRATVGREVLDEIASAVDVLRRVARAPTRSPLDRFREAFVERYERREVPLVEALDEEAGIGFDPSPEADAESSPLLDGLPLARAAEDSARRRDTQLAWLGTRGSGCGAPLELDAAEVELLAGVEPAPLPDAFAAMATVMATSREALAAGDFRVLVEMADGPSGARLLGRFCHGDSRLRSAVEAHLRAEEALQPGAVFAEIVHLPEGRVGNVLCRPGLRAHEIPFLGRSGAPAAAQIALDDLTISVAGPRIVLRSRRLGREVIPRLSTAHNYVSRSLGIYRFLCSLQEQGRATRLMWSWGTLEGAAFLPRVVHGRAILARARWRVTKDEIPDLSAPVSGSAFAAARRWREGRGVPRFAVLADLDNRLVVDFENVLAVESFAALVARRDDFVLEEMLPPPEQMVAEGPEGRFAHEIVVPFVRAAPGPPGEEEAGRASSRSTIEAPAAASSARRPASRPRLQFMPGSEWLYAKLYSGPAGTDPLLREVVSPLLERLGDRLACWFFVRFGDPQWHLRLRLKGDPRFLASEALPSLEALLAPRLADGHLVKVSLDTYEPELERYGGPQGLALSERLFDADSRCVLEIVRTLQGDAGLEARWRLALRGSDLLMEDLGLEPARRVALLETTRETLARELRVDRAFELSLDLRFRERRASLERLLQPAAESESDLSPGLAMLRERSRRLTPVIANLRAAERQGRLTESLDTLALSYVHMHCNRLLRSAHRAQELVIYDFLIRLHRSRAGRERAPDRARRS